MNRNSEQLDFIKTQYKSEFSNQSTPYYSDYLQINLVNSSSDSNEINAYYSNDKGINFDYTTQQANILYSPTNSYVEDFYAVEYNNSNQEKPEKIKTTKKTKSLSPSSSTSTSSSSSTTTTSASTKKQRKRNIDKNWQLPPSPTILKKRRLAANARERKRMNSLNEAYERLREIVPSSQTEEQKMSKYETLQMAHTYILALFDLLQISESESERINTLSQIFPNGIGS